MAEKGCKSPGLGQPLQQVDFFHQPLGDIRIVALSGGLVRTGAGEQHGVHLGLRLRNGDLFQYEFLFCDGMNRRAANDAIVAAVGTP